MASGLKDWAEAKAPEKVSLEHEQKRGAATSLSNKANDATVAAKATSTHADKGETAKLQAGAADAHHAAAKAWRGVDDKKSSDHENKGLALGDRAAAHASEHAHAMSATANKSGSSEDHKAAADAHKSALDIIDKHGSIDSFEGRDIQKHRDAAKDHEEKAKSSDAKGGGGSDEMNRDDHGRFAPK